MRGARSVFWALVAVVVLGFAGIWMVEVDCAVAVSGRAYEMVSPVYKDNNGALLEAVAPNGESVTFTSEGAFAELPVALTGNAYVSVRHAGGWFTAALQPLTNGITDFSSDLLYALGQNSIKSSGFQFTRHDLETSDMASNWDAFGPVVPGKETVFYRGASGDLCHMVVEGEGLTETAPTKLKELYSVEGCGAGEEVPLSLVSVSNGFTAGAPKVIGECASFVGDGIEQGTTFGSVSGDGSEVFFSANVESASAKCAGGGLYQVFVRLGGARTVEVSRPVTPAAPFGGCGSEGEVPCPGAETRAGSTYRGASEDGSLVYFTTTGEFVSGDEDKTENLYLARIGCPEGEEMCAVADRRVTALERVSEDPIAGQGAEVFGVVDVAPSGAVYFVAHGALTDVANGEGEVAADGADNLYGYDPQSRRLMFIAQMCSGPRASGSREDVHCPTQLDNEHNDSGLWGPDGLAQVTDGGRFLVFATFAQLVRRGRSADTDTSSDIYRFDLASGALERISLGEEGFHANGNVNGFGDDAVIAPGSYGGERGASIMTEHELSDRTVSPDGSWVTFSSAAPLSVYALNGKMNVYAWHENAGTGEGSVSLVSSGTAGTDDVDPVIAPETSPEGRDIFFTTTANLIPVDTENDADVYDARIGGGFASTPVSVAPCAGDACQSGLTPPAQLLTPGSATQLPGENWPPPSQKHVRPKKHVKKHVKHAKKKGSKKTKRGKRARAGSRGHGQGGGR